MTDTAKLTPTEAALKEAYKRLSKALGQATEAQEDIDALLAKKPADEAAFGGTNPGVPWAGRPFAKNDLRAWRHAAKDAGLLDRVTD